MNLISKMLKDTHETLEGILQKGIVDILEKKGDQEKAKEKIEKLRKAQNVFYEEMNNLISKKSDN